MRHTHRSKRSRMPLKDGAYVAIRDMIMVGSLPPGDVLSKRQLAQQLRMSKTPVGSALERLEAEGFVAISPRRGFIVRDLSACGLMDLFDLRLALEPFVVQRLAGRLTQAQAESLLANTKTQTGSAKDGDVPRSIRLDTEYHLMLCQFLGNSIILGIMSNLMSKLQQMIAWVVSRHPERLTASPQEHAAIADALIKGDGDRAAEKMVSHLTLGRQHIAA